MLHNYESSYPLVEEDQLFFLQSSTARFPCKADCIAPVKKRNDTVNFNNDIGLYTQVKKIARKKKTEVRTEQRSFDESIYLKIKSQHNELISDTSNEVQIQNINKEKSTVVKSESESHDKTKNTKITRTTNKTPKTFCIGMPYEVIIMPSYLRSHQYMLFSWKFSDVNGLSDHNMIKLINTDGKYWNVQINHKRVKHGDSGNISYIGVGWKKFVTGNKLKVGDKCIFRKLKDNDISVEVQQVQTNSMDI